MKFIASIHQPINTIINPELLKQYSVFDSFFAGDETCELFETKTSKVYLLGRIYNLDKLRNTYETTGNTASLVWSIYQKESFKGFKLLDGEYTFVIKEEDQIIVYRDRHGASCQVYFTEKYISTHQNTLVQCKDFKTEVNFDNLALFLKNGYIPAPETALEGVGKLPGGQVLIYKDNKTKLQELYGYEDFGSSLDTIKISDIEATKEYERLHKEAIQERVKGASEVQLLLSGGYDSGGNISGLREVYQGKASSYSIGFKDNPWSELPLAKLMSEVYNTSHYEYEIDGTEIEFLPEIINHFGDPFNESGMMVNYTAMKLVSDKKGKGIILGGDGNDQHFGTAGRELALHYKYKKNGIQMLQKMVDAFSEMSFFNKDNTFFKIRFHNEKVLNILENDSFGFREHQIKKLLKVKVDISKPQYLQALPRHFSSFNDLYNIHNYFGDIKQVINEVILFKASKLAEHFDNHLSFPYMSTDLYNFLKVLPREVKLKGDINACASGAGKSKFLHKNYLYPKLPKEITERKKQGGFAPLPIFFKDTKQFNKIADIILNSDLVKNHFDKKYLESILDAYRSNKDNVGYWFWYKQVQAFQIFNLISLVVWWAIIVEKREIKTLSDL